MYTREERMRAIDLYIKYGKRRTRVIRELGYPTMETLRLWYKEYLIEQQTGIVHPIRAWKVKYSPNQKQEAVEHYLNNGRNCKLTMRELGYPSQKVLEKWIDEIAPGQRHRYKNRVNLSKEQMRAAVLDYCSGKCSAQEISESCGIHPDTVRAWKRTMFGKEVKPMRKTPEEKAIEKLEEKLVVLRKETADLESKRYRLQLEVDILEGTRELLKKEKGVDPKNLSNREKTILVDALRKSHPLPVLLERMIIAKSSYYYQRKACSRPDKHAGLRTRIRETFEGNRRRYGYRRVHACLVREGNRVSEKVVRRIMKEESCTIRVRRRRKYSSYMGEISPAVPNVLNRDFRAKRPNEKWLTDLTEFHIPAGKVYLSPIVDCFDGMVVSWTIGTTPDANLVTKMLDLATATLKPWERPIVHSDRGNHYRWPDWIERLDRAKLTRSMSKKGCSPDNAACEGFFGRLKTEMFYGRSWAGVSIEAFIEILNQYISWYNEVRIKMSLGAMSPLEYRQSLGLVA